MEPTPEPRAKLYINTGLVTDKSDIYNILRPLLKQTVTYSYFRGNQVASGGTGWVERLVVDHPEIASYFTPLSICLNLDSFDYLQFDTTSDQLLTYTLVIGSEKCPVPSESTNLCCPALISVSSCSANSVGLPSPALPPSTRSKSSPLPVGGG